MTKPKDVLNIAYGPSLGVTALRQYPKETLIEAIIEMKQANTEATMAHNEQQFQLALMDRQLEMKRIEANLITTKSLFENTELMKDHKYGPKAIGDISNSLATIWSSPGKSDNPLTKEEEEFNERVQKARQQGLRWNKADKEPERRTTVIKKLEAWEKDHRRGQESDPESYLGKKYEEILKTEGGEAFMVGLCEKIESKYGIGPMSKYLKTRHKRCMEKLGKGVNPVESGPVVPTLTNTDHAIELIKRAWGNSLDDFNYNDIKKHLIRRLDSAGGVDKIELKPFRGLCDAKSLPNFFEYTEKPEHPLDKLKDIKAGKYDEHFIKLLDDYRAEVAGK